MNDAGLPLLFRQNIIGIVYTNCGFAVYALTGGKCLVFIKNVLVDCECEIYEIGNNS